MFRSGRLDQLKLGQRGHAIVEADLLDNLAADYLQHRRAGEVYLPAGRSRQAADQEVIEGRTCMGSTTKGGALCPVWEHPGGKVAAHAEGLCEL